jgi:hypothetical protein
VKGGVASGEGGVFVFFSEVIGVRNLARPEGLLNIESFCAGFPGAGAGDRP